MKYSEEERHEIALSISLIRANQLSLLDSVKEQVTVEKERKRMAEVSSAVELFLKDKADTGNAATSMRTLRSIVLRFASVFDGRLLDEVTHNEIKSWLTLYNIGTTTKNNYVKEVKNLYNWATLQGMSTVNPTARIERYRHTIEELETKENAKEILTTGEVDKLLHNTWEKYPLLMPRVAIQLYAGTRPERESASITDENIYMEDGIIHVPASKAKDRKERFIKICPKLREILTKCRKFNIGVRKCNSWDSQWDSLKESIGLLGNWPNSCTRHTFASYSLVKFGADYTKEALGHGNYDMLFKHYRTLVHPKEAEDYFSVNNLIEKIA